MGGLVHGTAVQCMHRMVVHTIFVWLDRGAYLTILCRFLDEQVCMALLFATCQPWMSCNR
jgi:hypothetical protein